MPIERDCSEIPIHVFHYNPRLDKYVCPHCGEVLKMLGEKQ